MASSPRSEREEERRHNIRTLVIASVASATAAAVTSQLWIAGTWIAAAVTPVLVALVSEILNRPADRLARAWTSERPALPEDAEEPRPARPTPQPRTTPPSAPGETPVRIYRQPSARPPRRRKLAVGAILATGLLAFAIAAVTLTAGELLAGGSIGKGDKRTTFFRGAKTEQQNKKQPADERQTDTTERQPAETTRETPSEQPTETETTPPETTTETTPVPTPRSAPAAPEAAPPTETAPVP
jgi:hypothetical protein